VREKVEAYKEEFKGGSLEFTSVNNGEYAPEVCNEFISLYCEENTRGGLSRAELIDLTQHFCWWLFNNKLTCSKLSMAR